MQYALVRTVFDRLGTTHVQSHNHYVGDGTLIIRNADWKNGRLDLAVVVSNWANDQESIEVAIRVAYERNSMYLDSFKALTVHRAAFGDPLGTLEYRIPEYDYTMQVPIHFKGMKTENTRRREEFEKSLSAADLQIWRRLGPTIFDGLGYQDAKAEELAVRRIVPNWDGKRDLTEDENRRLEQWMREILSNAAKQKLTGSGISPVGQKQILDFLSSAPFGR